MITHRRKKTSWCIAALALGAVTIATITAAADALEPWTAPVRAAKKKNPITADATVLERGKTVWAKECASCHGGTGHGDGPAVKDLERKPGDITLAATQEQSDGALFWKLTTGRAPMASYETTLSEEDRWSVILYLRTLAPHPAQ